MLCYEILVLKHLMELYAPFILLSFHFVYLLEGKLYFSGLAFTCSIRILMWRTMSKACPIPTYPENVLHPCWGPTKLLHCQDLLKTSTMAPTVVYQNFSQDYWWLIMKICISVTNVRMLNIFSWWRYFLLLQIYNNVHSSLLYLTSRIL